MILIVLYFFAGIYILTMSMGFLHKDFVNSMSTGRRNGLAVLGAGFFLLGLSYGFYYLKGPAKENRSQHELIEKYRTP